MNDKVYIPHFDSNTCVSVDYINQGYLRAYERQPYANSSINYTDYFINSHYLSRSGYQSFGNYYNSVSCIPIERLTNEVEYRNDFDQILIIFLILAIVIVVVPTKIVFRLFRRLK